ncbi:hypothetical protein [uncultured Brevibacillus sp.]|uniref:hypothetical protein n=1 Tax=uncultured Brevibacillus sp. TaxID=169970 RepID=UPI002595CEEE|nr:hypothetical protein [uncultured Brevibacillus sp.]
MKMTIDFLELLTTGVVGKFQGGESKEEIVNLIGEPEIYTPERKSYPSYIIYGDLEFRLRKNRVETIVITLHDETLKMPSSINMENFPKRNFLKFEFVKGLLTEKGVSWEPDVLMSDQYQVNYISEKGVHFAFDLEKSKVLSKIGIVYKSISID